eukprot:TRINITY_DN1992_c0_g1_i1.p1 TRINITY_DN1992_c0_g1~~TRINITY_DN1992_c0_g1_i1.p1  ORF type:complete len:127 (-),score=12.09 TRINITY_DN1992_c0_g1_i1:29-409(-)
MRHDATRKQMKQAQWQRHVESQVLNAAFSGAERCHIRVNQAVEREGKELRSNAQLRCCRCDIQHRGVCRSCRCIAMLVDQYPQLVRTLVVCVEHQIVWKYCTIAIAVSIPLSAFVRSSSNEARQFK